MKSQKILIVQFRTDESKIHERQCFMDELSEYEDALVFVDAITEEFPQDLSDVRAVILAGSGEFYLVDGAGLGSWREKTLSFIETILEKDIPLLGICFGFQLLGVQQGAQIVNDPAMRETGTFSIHLDPQAMQDELFSQAPKVFVGQLAHRDTVVALPPHLIQLASSSLVACNAFRISGKRAWGVLFHPELSQDRMRTRFSMLPQYGYGRPISEMLALFEDTPHATALLHRFVQLSGKQALT